MQINKYLIIHINVAIILILVHINLYVWTYEPALYKIK